MNLKTAGVFFIMTAFSMTGLKISASLSKREKSLRCMILMINKIETMIDYSSYHVNEVLFRLASDSSLDVLEFLKTAEKYVKSGKKFYEAWEYAVKASRFSGEKEKEILLAMGSSLGKTGRKGQISMLDIHIKSLENLLGSEMPEIYRKKKLYSSLGILAGVFISVMLI